MTETIPVRCALISAFDKRGLPERARKLADMGVTIVSTGGTAETLQGAGLAVTDIADLTGYPEMMDGRVKTLHPVIHGGLLHKRDNPAHQAEIDRHSIRAIDLVYINLYPFETAIAAQDDFADCIEMIDIGGPAMLRAAAKNADWVAVCSDHDDLDRVLEEMSASNGHVEARTRHMLAAKAYTRTAAYDSAIANWYADRAGLDAPAWRTFGGKCRQTLRYGENPHQRATFYITDETRPGIATARQIQGKDLSYNNINDTDAAYELIGELGTDKPATAIIKHANPCGVALGESLTEAYLRALACDPASAFGGVIALNHRLDSETATQISQHFTEIVIAPGASDGARSILAKKPNIRLLVTDDLPDPTVPDTLVKTVAGGLLVQDRDTGRLEAGDLEVVTRKTPDKAAIADLLFAWRVAKHVKSNAIVYAKNEATVGIGAGQMSRIDSARIAAQKAENIQAENSQTTGNVAATGPDGCVAASDAFFPFPDAVTAIAKAGAKAIIQPGGSIRDNQVIAKADELGLSMVLTNMRHFRH